MDIDEIAFALKSEFIEQKRKIAKGYNLGAGHLHDSFVKAAKVMLDLDAEPDMFILAQFHGQNDSAKMVPQFLSTQIAKDRYKKFMEEMFSTEVTYDMIYNENVARLEAQRRLGFSDPEILRSMSFRFAPWFRLCYPKEPILSLMANDKLREKALREFNQELKQFLIAKKLDYKRVTLWTPPHKKNEHLQ